MHFNVLRKRNRIHKQMNRWWQFLLYVYITFYSSSLDVICKLWHTDTFSSMWKGLSENATSFLHHFGFDSYPSQPLLTSPAALYLILLMVWMTSCCSCAFSSSVGIHVVLRITCLLLSAGDPPTDSCFLGYSNWSMLASQTSDCHISCLTKDSKSFLSVWEQQEQGCSTGEYKLAVSTATAHCTPMIPSWAEQHPRRLLTSQWPSDGWKVMSQVQDEPRISSQEVRKHVWALSDQ